MRLAQRHLSGKTEALHDRSRLPPARELEQCERVAIGLHEDPIPHSCVERGGYGRIEQLAGLVAGQSLDRQLGQPLELVPALRLAQREHDPHSFRQESSRNECERLRGDSVEPLRVVDDAQERLLLGCVGQQAEGRQPHEEPIRRGTSTQPECRVQRVALRARQMLDAVEHRYAQRMQAGECELHLGLDARRTNDPTSLC